MRVIEMKRNGFPNKADKAKIEWESNCEGSGINEDLEMGCDGMIKAPRREGDVIILPEYYDSEFFWLDDEQRQFIFTLSNVNFFGGTDENPFLVRLKNSSDLKNYLLHGDTESFFERLNPIDHALRKDNNWRRQGDIFGYLSPFTIDEVDKGFKNYSALSRKMFSKESEIKCHITKQEKKLFETRHVFKGGGCV